jgi:hypothetical protein
MNFGKNSVKIGSLPHLLCICQKVLSRNLILFVMFTQLSEMESLAPANPQVFRRDSQSIAHNTCTVAVPDNPFCACHVVVQQPGVAVTVGFGVWVRTVAQSMRSATQREVI